MDIGQSLFLPLEFLQHETHKYKNRSAFMGIIYIQRIYIMYIVLPYPVSFRKKIKINPRKKNLFHSSVCYHLPMSGKRLD